MFCIKQCVRVHVRECSVRFLYACTVVCDVCHVWTTCIHTCIQTLKRCCQAPCEPASARLGGKCSRYRTSRKWCNQSWSTLDFDDVIFVPNRLLQYLRFEVKTCVFSPPSKYSGVYSPSSHASTHFPVYLYFQVFSNSHSYNALNSILVLFLSL